MGRQKKKKTKTPLQFDRGLLILAILLTLLGIVAIANASAPQAQRTFSDSFYFVKQQLAWGAVGIVALLVASRLKYTLWKKIAPVAFWISVGLLAAVLVPGLGVTVLGARRWLQLGPIGFQPSELVKLTLALYLAQLSETEKPLTSYLVAIGVVVGLVMLQPDFGTTIVICAIGIVSLFVIGVDLVSFIIILAPAILGSVAMVVFSDYRRQRLITYLHNFFTPLASSTEAASGTSYHIRQILLAIGSGGILGVGLGQSRQKYLFLPEVATDSVFAVIAEEVGFLGSLVIVILLAFFIYKIMKIALNATDDFSRILASGIAAWIGGQTFLNIGSMVALIPLTGIPLPFFSYGGSSLTMTLLSVGILINISAHKKTEYQKRR